MARHYTTQGFVFRKVDVGEYDRLYKVYTERFGRVDLFCKAARKIGSKLRGHLEPGSFAVISFVQGRRRKTLTGARAVPDESCRFGGTGGKSCELQLVRRKLAFEISALFDTVVAGEEADERVWQLLYSVHNTLAGNGASGWQVLFYYFFWNFFSLLGYRPSLEKCLRCGRSWQEDMRFDPQQGGVVCASHAQDAAPISSGARAALQELLRVAPEEIAPRRFSVAELAELKRLSNLYLSLFA